MAERFRGSYEYPRQVHTERPLSFEQKEVLHNILLEIDKLLARLVEAGEDLPGDIKQAMRAKIQEYLLEVGQLSGIAIAGIEDLAKVYDWTARACNRMPIPSDYPGEYAFEQALYEVMSTSRRESLSQVPPNISAEEVAHFAQLDWNVVTGRGGQPTVSYLYRLGILMTDCYAYRNIFSGRSDNIVIGYDWNVENGRHRALSMRALGGDFVTSVGMDRWLSIEREP